jgi:MFS superfamily sulfate permease-like transporter
VEAASLRSLHFLVSARAMAGRLARAGTRTNQENMSQGAQNTATSAAGAASAVNHLILAYFYDSFRTKRSEICL